MTRKRRLSLPRSGGGIAPVHLLRRFAQLQEDREGLLGGRRFPGADREPTAGSLISVADIWMRWLDCSFRCCGCARGQGW